MFGHLPHAHVVVGHDLYELLVGIGVRVVAAVSQTRTGVRPVTLGHALGLGGATGAEAFATGATVMLRIGRQIGLLALVEVINLVGGFVVCTPT